MLSPPQKWQTKASTYCVHITLMNDFNPPLLRLPTLQLQPNREQCGEVKEEKRRTGQRKQRKHASISVGALRHTTHVVNVFTFKHTISTKKLVSGSKSIWAVVLKITSINCNYSTEGWQATFATVAFKNQHECSIPCQIS